MSLNYKEDVTQNQEKDSIGIFEKWLEEVLTNKAYRVSSKFIEDNQVVEKLNFDEHSRILFRDNFASYYISKLYGSDANDLDHAISESNMENIPLLSSIFRFNKMTSRVADRISEKLNNYNDVLSKIIDGEKKLATLMKSNSSEINNPRLVIFAANLLSTTYVQSIRLGEDASEKIKYQLATIKVVSP